MNMHFEPERGDATAWQVIELRTDTRLAARLIATREGITIDVAEGFEIVTTLDTSDQPDAHVAFRERE
jgi:hypothetical protein